MGENLLKEIEKGSKMAVMKMCIRDSSGSDGFVSFEQAFLDIPVERSIEPGVSQLI